MPWTATMYVTGDEAIWVEEKCKDHWLWFPNVGKLAKYSRKLKAGMPPYGYGTRLLGYCLIQDKNDIGLLKKISSLTRMSQDISLVCPGQFIFQYIFRVVNQRK